MLSSRHRSYYNGLLLLFTVLISNADPLYSQAGKKVFTISGVVKSTNSEVLAGATVLAHCRNCSENRSVATDEEGLFKLLLEVAVDSIPAIIVTATMTGYQDNILAVTVDTLRANGTINIGELKLMPVTAVLKAVEIRARPPLVSQDHEKMVVNVENSVLAASLNAFEVLQKSPGISVEESGIIQIKGRTGASVLLNGRPTYLSADQLVTYLKSLPGNTISKIEIITNPSARYDASGTGGILNIVTSRRVNPGLSGSAYTSAFQARFNQLQAGLNVGYRNRHWDLYTGLNLAKERYWTASEMSTTFKSQNGVKSNSLIRNADGSFSTVKQNAHISLSYLLNKFNTLTVGVSGIRNRSKTSWLNSVNYFYSGSDAIDSLSRSNLTGESSFESLTYSVNYKLLLDSTGGELLVSGDLSDYEIPELQIINTTSFDANNHQTGPSSLVSSSQPRNVRIQSVKADYIKRFKNINVEGGVKYSKVINENVIDFKIFDDNSWHTDPKTSNAFTYTEDIMAAYVNASLDSKKGWSWQLGGRFENTGVSGEQVVNDSFFRRNYMNFFPSVAVNKRISADHSIGLSFSRRIERPSYQHINPFRYYIDNFQYRVGNVNLQPQYANSVELNYILLSKYFLSLNYVYTTNLITPLNTQDATTFKTYQGYANLGKQHFASISLNAPLQVAAWWNANVTSTLLHKTAISQQSGQPFRQSQMSIYLTLHQTIQLPANTNFEITGFYQSKQQAGYFSIQPVGSMSGGFTRKFKKQGITVRVAADDIFNTWKNRSLQLNENAEAATSTRWMSRKFSLSVNYSFGNKQLKHIKRSGSSDIEENRIY